MDGMEWKCDSEDQIGAGQVQDEEICDSFQVLVYGNSTQEETVACDTEDEDQNEDGTTDGIKVKWILTKIYHTIVNVACTSFAHCGVERHCRFSRKHEHKATICKMKLKEYLIHEMIICIAITHQDFVFLACVSSKRKIQKFLIYWSKGGPHLTTAKTISNQLYTNSQTTCAV